MSTNDDTPSFDDLDTVEIDNDDGASEWIDLEPGQEVTGRITGLNLEAGYNGVIEIDGRPMYLNKQMRRQLVTALVEGAHMGVRMSEETETFEQDGEKQEYHPKEVRFQA